MDALYENLDNYNETNAIQELRSENQELKAKIEKYTVTLEMLQKDFDKLAMEYKKLEMNYSSLLKTARAEIERKTQIITNLNIEKDMMVLNAIQNNTFGNVRRNWAIAKATHSKSNEMDNQNRKPAENQPKSRSSSTGRKEVSEAPTEDTNNPVTTENTNKLNIRNEKCVEHKSDAKENICDVKKARPASIRDRRKSLPATRLAKFSSDEEDEGSPAVEQRKDQSKESNGRRHFPTKDNKPQDSRKKNYDNDKYRSRDRFESQRYRYSPERFLRRSKRDYSGDRRFHKDLKDHRQQRDGIGGYRSDKDGERFHRDGPGDNRHYRDRSGDRRPYRDNSGDHRPHRGGSRDNKHRKEEPEDNKQPEMRKRRLESPASDKFHQYQQKNHEEFEQDYNDERNKYVEDIANPKYHSDYEEPSVKRLRTDSYHRNDQDNKCRRGKVLEQAVQPAVGNIQGEDISCQSPDYLSSELASTPKEIKLNAEVKMDDPREHSNRYTIRTENGEKVLSTVHGRNVDLKPVNKSVWNVIEVEIPIALVRLPSLGSEDRTNEALVDMDIDNPASDISSIESGETMGSIYDISTDPFHYEHRNDFRRKENIGNIKRYNNDTAQVNNVIEKPKSFEKVEAQVGNVVDIYENVIIHPEKKFETQENKIMQTETVADDAQTLKKGIIPGGNVTENQQIDENATIQPEIIEQKSSEKDSNQTERVVKPSKSDKNVEETVDSKEPSNIWKSKYKIPKMRKEDQYGGRESNQSDNKQTEDIFEADKLDNVSFKHKPANKNSGIGDTERKNDHQTAVATDKGMVEGDLELSDESCDVELMKRVMKEIAEQSSCELSKGTKSILDKVDRKENTECIHKCNSNDVKKNDVLLKLSGKDKSGSSVNTKKSKIKTTKQKSVTETLKNPQDDVLNKHSKPKMQEKEVKSKFCDLFGDSSSLITPEDLGLTAPEVRIESSSSNYFPIFEDAQDAADLGGKVGQTQIDVPPVILEEPQNEVTKSNKNTDQDKEMDKNESITNTSKSKKVHVDKGTDKDATKHKSKHNKSRDKEHDGKPVDTNEIKIKLCKNKEVEHVSKIIDVNVTKTKACKNLEKQVKKTDAGETKSKSKSSKNKEKELHDANPVNTIEIKSKTKHSKNETDKVNTKAKCSKNSEPQQGDDKLYDTNQSKLSKDIENIEASEPKAKTIEVRRRKSRRHEKEPQPTVETEDTPQPAVITSENNTTTAQQTSNKSDSLISKEPEIVKTVIVSTGIQPLSVQENLPVNVISPILEQPVTPNIDSRRTLLGIPVSSNSVHIHALATSTPAKEMVQNVQEVSCRTPDVSNTSNDQNSISNNVDSHNDMDAPDVRIFVKRKRRVVKKTTPSKT